LTQSVVGLKKIRAKIFADQKIVITATPKISSEPVVGITNESISASYVFASTKEISSLNLSPLLKSSPDASDRVTASLFGSPTTSASSPTIPLAESGYTEGIAPSTITAKASNPFSFKYAAFKGVPSFSSTHKHSSTHANVASLSASAPISFASLSSSSSYSRTLKASATPVSQSYLQHKSISSGSSPESYSALSPMSSLESSQEKLQDLSLCCSEKYVISSDLSTTLPNSKNMSNADFSIIPIFDLQL
jgi:hypothetical protein